MEPGSSARPREVRDRKGELLGAVRPFSADELVRGQYPAGASTRRDGRSVIED
jgi:glucose-6-phosphate 1-dehydrogenase